MNERERKKETLNFYDLFMKTIEKKTITIIIIIIIAIR